VTRTLPRNVTERTDNRFRLLLCSTAQFYRLRQDKKEFSGWSE